MNTEQQIRQRIDAFVRDLQALLVEAARESVVAALGGATAPSGRGTRRAAAPRAKKAGRPSGRRVRRSAEQLAQVQEKVIAVLTKKPGLTSEEIQENLGLEKKDLQRPLTLLRDERRIKTKGQKRGMKYFAA